METVCVCVCYLISLRWFISESVCCVKTDTLVIFGISSLIKGPTLMEPLLCNRSVSIFTLVVLKNQSLNQQTFVFRGQCWQLGDRKHGLGRGEGGGTFCHKEPQLEQNWQLCGHVACVVTFSGWVITFQSQEPCNQSPVCSIRPLLVNHICCWEGGGGSTNLSCVDFYENL